MEQTTLFMYHDHSTIIGSLTGFILSIWAIPSTADFEHTITLALTGAIVGFFGSLLCKFIWKKIKHLFKKK